MPCNKFLLNKAYFVFLNNFLDKKPPKEWPDKGKIIFNKLYLRYDPEAPFVLKNITVTIEATEKVLIISLLNYYTILKYLYNYINNIK